jgi:hypothetical protein
MKEFQMTTEELQEAWSNIESALEEAMEQYNLPIPPGVRAGIRATFSVSTLVKSGLLTQQEGKLFHDIRAFKDGNTQWTGDYTVVEAAWLLAEYIREA